MSAVYGISSLRILRLPFLYEGGDLIIPEESILLIVIITMLIVFIFYASPSPPNSSSPAVTPSPSAFSPSFDAFSYSSTSSSSSIHTTSYPIVTHAPLICSLSRAICMGMQQSLSFLITASFLVPFVIRPLFRAYPFRNHISPLTPNSLFVHSLYESYYSSSDPQESSFIVIRLIKGLLYGLRSLLVSVDSFLFGKDEGWSMFGNMVFGSGDDMWISLADFEKHFCLFSTVLIFGVSLASSLFSWYFSSPLTSELNNRGHFGHPLRRFLYRIKRLDLWNSKEEVEIKSSVPHATSFITWIPKKFAEWVDDWFVFNDDYVSDNLANIQTSLSLKVEIAKRVDDTDISALLNPSVMKLQQAENETIIIRFLAQSLCLSLSNCKSSSPSSMDFNAPLPVSRQKSNYPVLCSPLTRRLIISELEKRMKPPRPKRKSQSLESQPSEAVPSSSSSSSSFNQNWNSPRSASASASSSSSSSSSFAALSQMGVDQQLPSEAINDPSLACSIILSDNSGHLLQETVFPALQLILRFLERSSAIPINLNSYLLSATEEAIVRGRWKKAQRKREKKQKQSRDGSGIGKSIAFKDSSEQPADEGDEIRMLSLLMGKHADDEGSIDRAIREHEDSQKIRRSFSLRQPLNPLPFFTLLSVDDLRSIRLLRRVVENSMWRTTEDMLSCGSSSRSLKRKSMAVTGKTPLFAPSFKQMHFVPLSFFVQKFQREVSKSPLYGDNQIERQVEADDASFIGSLIPPPPPLHSAGITLFDLCVNGSLSPEQRNGDQPDWQKSIFGTRDSSKYNTFSRQRGSQYTSTALPQFRGYMEREYIENSENEEWNGIFDASFITERDRKAATGMKKREKSKDRSNGQQSKSAAKALKSLSSQSSSESSDLLESAARQQAIINSGARMLSEEESEPASTLFAREDSEEDDDTVIYILGVFMSKKKRKSWRSQLNQDKIRNPQVTNKKRVAKYIGKGLYSIFVHPLKSLLRSFLLFFLRIGASVFFFIRRLIHFFACFFPFSQISRFISVALRHPAPSPFAAAPPQSLFALFALQDASSVASAVAVVTDIVLSSASHDLLSTLSQNLSLEGVVSIFLVLWRRVEELEVVLEMMAFPEASKKISGSRTDLDFVERKRYSGYTQLTHLKEVLHNSLRSIIQTYRPRIVAALNRFNQEEKAILLQFLEHKI
ncbi:uncharacterized protein MONOS_646 [Monocercomonoides exilis]|uniref:uncharacterized protein n=1 Tax=Monocercomonoides exilis TaxID=2049356 RepID=UPI00355A8B71|nr:hypothetical protein MONOS_646 [Monocercomonoides exilis]|eukprot:MONOS_646.1-p1 / transcript=MONOS_646.1 / gene=MONOS_646 / organism=Monocercomonoides_exilis_PA203 / gene_product=unspecified product / transcript_product=unspecified product / location=Mono_scaffold00010:253425-257021(+) / protein_length=1179 / sequence_SO=supercontig / SO=protein_coding / is_pseudo=false